MNSWRIFQIIAGVLLLVAGAFVFPIHTDQEFINLTPSEGAGFLVSIKSGSIYEQTFAVQSQSISKIGAYLIPIQTSAKTSGGAIHIDILQHGNIQASGDIPVFGIDNEGASLIQIAPPLATSRGELLTMRISVSPDASGLIALKKRMFDETFPDRDISFAINGIKEQYPVGYKVFESIWPPFVMQVGGIFIMAGIFLLFWKSAVQRKNVSTIIILIGIIALYAIPSYTTYPLFMPLVLLLMLSVWFLFRVAGRTNLASIFGAIIFVCSSYIPLQFIAGGIYEGSLSIRDALLDPNQISVSHGAGAYIGIPAALFAIAGVAIWFVSLLKKRFVASQIDSMMAIFFILSLSITFIHSAIQMPRAIILVVFCIAWFASLAFDTMQRFLGLRDIFLQTLMAVLLTISLLDLMHITARTFEYGLGI